MSILEKRKIVDDNWIYRPFGQLVETDEIETNIDYVGLSNDDETFLYPFIKNSVMYVTTNCDFLETTLCKHIHIFCNMNSSNTGPVWNSFYKNEDAFPRQGIYLYKSNRDLVIKVQNKKNIAFDSFGNKYTGPYLYIISQSLVQRTLSLDRTNSEGFTSCKELVYQRVPCIKMLSVRGCNDENEDFFESLDITFLMTNNESIRFQNTIPTKYVEELVAKNELLINYVSDEDLTLKLFIWVIQLIAHKYKQNESYLNTLYTEFSKVSKRLDVFPDETIEDQEMINKAWFHALWCVVVLRQV